MTGWLRTFIFAVLVVGGYISVQLLAFPASAQQVPQRQLQQNQSVDPTTAVPVPAPVSRAPVRRVPIRRAVVTATPGNAGTVPTIVLDVPINEAKVVNLPARIQNIDVGDETIANVSYFPENNRQIFIHGRGFGKTTIIVTGRNNNILRQINVNVGFNPGGLEAALAKLLPDEKINISVHRGNIFLTGKVRSATASANAMAIAKRFAGTGAAAGNAAPTVNVVNMLTLLGSQQVIMKVRVSEMDRTVIKGMSVDQTFSSRFLDGARALSFSTTGLTQFDSTTNPFVSGTLTTNISGLAPSTFKMLEQQKLVKTLAEPVLTAISGESATFLAGGQVPVPIGVDQNGNAVIEYRDYGVRLEFTPVVIDQGRISLKISTEISSVSTSTTTVANSTNLSEFTTKRTTTTVELPSGGSVMISGMLKDNDTNTVAGFPFLKDIPILGALFRSTDFKKQKTELVVTVSAYLAKPTGADAALSLPTDGFEPASDIDIYLLGKLHRQYTKSDLPLWAAPLKGPFGYIME